MYYPPLGNFKTVGYYELLLSIELFFKNFWKSSSVKHWQDILFYYKIKSYKRYL